MRRAVKADSKPKKENNKMRAQIIETENRKEI